MAPIAYILKRFPRLSETFILNEVLELERQGVALHIFALGRPEEGPCHADVARVRSPITYVPESPLSAPRAFAEAHREVFRNCPRRYLRVLRKALRHRRASTLDNFLRAGYIAPAIRREGISHAHAHFAHTATSVVLQLHRLTAVPYSFTAHAKDIYLDSVSRSDLVRKLTSARFIVTVSDYNREYLSSLAGGSRVLRIYNGVDLRRLSPNGIVRDELPLILGVGRLIEKKGFADLVGACALLRQQGRRFRCQIVGQGPLEGDLRAQIRELGVMGEVELAGPLEHERLVQLYPRASMVVAPCIVGSNGDRDGLPTVLIEAMAFGVPVISTPVTGIPELVEDGRTGLLVPQRDPVALAAAIARLLDDRRESVRLVQSARARVERDFDLQSNVARLHELLETAGAG